VWPPEALEFLRELEDNNDSAWFRANRARYDQFLLGPARELTRKLSHLGEPRFFRPYNNLRFRPGPPLKEHLGVAIVPKGVGAFYFELSLDGLLVGGGLHHPASDQLERFRAAVADGRRARGFEQAVATAEAAGLTLVEPELKRTPRGYPNDHPRRDRLRLKRVTVFHRHPLEPWLHKARCDQLMSAQLDATAPLLRWLGNGVGASTSPPRPR
jgi:uncharacterized protein (TIGR02453 family)